MYWPGGLRTLKSPSGVRCCWRSLLSSLLRARSSTWILPLRSSPRWRSCSCSPTSSGSTRWQLHWQFSARKLPWFCSPSSGSTRGREDGDSRQNARLPFPRGFRSSLHSCLWPPGRSFTTMQRAFGRAIAATSVTTCTPRYRRRGYSGVLRAASMNSFSRDSIGSSLYARR